MPALLRPDDWPDVRTGAGGLFAATFYVAPDGNDSWSGKIERPNAGRSDGPLATPAAARDAVRRLKAHGPLTEPVVVRIADGTYPLQQTLVFEPQDSGTVDAPVVYQAVDGARPVLSGGRKIRGFTPAKGEGPARQAGPTAAAWQVHLPDVAAGKWYFEDLYVGGRRATRARAPNEFYYYIRGNVESTIDPATGKRGPMPRRAFRADPKDLAPLASLSKDQLRDAVIVVYFSWENSVSRVAAVDPHAGTVLLSGDTAWPLGQRWSDAWGPMLRFHIENVKAALDAPGEWFLDRGGDLFYIPLAGEDMTKAEVVAPATVGLVRFAGDPQRGRFVEHVALQGLSFQHDRCPLPAQGYNSPQAAVEMPAAITADGARHVTIENCEVAHTGGYAIHFRRGCQELPRPALPDPRHGRRRRPHRRGLGPREPLQRQRHRTLHGRQQHHPFRRPPGPRRGRRVDRLQRLQPGHPQRHRRLPLHRRLRRLALGLRPQRIAPQPGRVQPHPSPRLGRAERHGRRLHPRHLARHHRQQQRDPRRLFLRLRRLGPLQRRRKLRHPDGEQPGLQHQDRRIPPALRPREPGRATTSSPSAARGSCSGPAPRSTSPSPSRTTSSTGAAARSTWAHGRTPT